MNELDRSIHLLTVPLPCTKNSLHRVFGRRKILSERARERRKLVIDAMRRQWRTKPLLGPVQVTYYVTPKCGGGHLPDLNAYDTEIFDCLQLAGIVGDDVQIQSGWRERLPPDFKHPCIKIEITELG